VPPSGPGGPGPKGDGNMSDKGAAGKDSGYTTDEDGTSFESDKRFSNFILFTGAFALAILFMVSNVLHIKKERDAKS
jgi:hypothetical protein